MSGRGAWPVAGTGGTKAYKDADRPGPYYFIGSGTFARNPNEVAVRAAVKAYQRALNRRLGGDNLVIDGRFGAVTSAAVTRFQKKNPDVGIWGGIGPDTSKALLLPDLLKVVEDEGFDYPNIVSGTIKTESLWDAGAVGFLDESDLGLAQINGTAHPEYSVAERLSPRVAFKFVIAYYENAFNQLGDDLDLVVASYNLGIGGARSWDRAGRPDEWTPSGATRPRNVRAYIDNILAG